MGFYMGKAQVAIEYVGVTAFLLVVITILAAFAYTTYFDTMKNRMMDDSLNSLSETVNQAYSLGKGTVLFVKISLPGEVTGYIANGRAVGFQFSNGAGTNDYWNSVDANVSCSQIMPICLPTTEGMHIIRVEYLDKNIVLSEFTG